MWDPAARPMSTPAPANPPYDMQMVVRPLLVLHVILASVSGICLVPCPYHSIASNHS